jgi:2-polyprenyl-3-methyl-5-hydroxy-6-metoxy-1,4-benzoquinol methylase
MNLKFRATQPELLDNLECQGEEVSQNLRELDFINKWLGGNALSISILKAYFKNRPSSSTPSRFLDLGSGSGDLAHQCHLLLQKKGQAYTVGIDANPFMCDYANTYHKEENLTFRCLNIFDAQELPEHDIFHACLILHHFTEEELINVFQKLKKETKELVIINDLHRHPLAYYSIKWLTQLFSKSEFVKHDAPLSVAKGFKKKELEKVILAAGWKPEQIEIRWRWAFRWAICLRQ